MCPQSPHPPVHQKLLQEIRSLRRKVRHLTQEIESIKNSSCDDTSSVKRMVLARGIQIFRGNPTQKLFFPPDLPPVDHARFYEMMKKYSFRLVLRDIIKHQERFGAQDLTHYCSPKVARRYCDFLSELGVIVTHGKDRFRTVVSPLYSFGPTLEWFIAEMFKREFASPAFHGVSLKGTASGGDYDVIVSWNRRLVYVEVKSSPPKGVEWREIAAFFSRIDDLLPEVAVLFNDTQLRMKDKLVPLVEDEMERKYGKVSKQLYPVERLAGELFHLRHRVFIINSKKDVTENFSICLRDHLRYGERT